nr:hypothetical protein GCM10020092_002140 [Actinoplanes digitatis]
MRNVCRQQEEVVVRGVFGGEDPANDLDQFVAGDVGDLRPRRAGRFECEILDVARFPVREEVFRVVGVAGVGVEGGDRGISRFAAFEQLGDVLDGSTKLRDALG